MSDTWKNNEYLDELIRYKNNKMSNQERHQLERALERDPFLAEALEGFSEFKSSDLEKDLASIDLISGKRKFHINPVVYISVAASVAILVVSIVLFKGIGDKRQIAKVESTELKQPFTFTDSSFKKSETDNLEPEKDSVELLFAESRINETKTKEKESGFSAIPLTEKATTDKTSEQKVIASKKGEVKPSAQFAALKGDQDSANEVAVVASAAPQVDQTPKVKVEPVSLENSFEKIAEVGNEPVDQNIRPGVNAKPEPLGGFDLFKSYVDKNIIYPVSETDGSREVIKVQFTVSTTGSLSNFSFDRAPDNADFSNEAIRLLKNGPKWAPAVKDGVPVEDAASYRFVFKPGTK